MMSTHTGYAWMFWGSLMMILSALLSWYWHHRNKTLPDPHESDDPWDSMEWAKYQNLANHLNRVRIVGMFCLYGGSLGAVLGFLLVGIAGYFGGTC